MEYQAVWNGAVLAHSPDTVVVEGNRYFPPDSLNMRHFERSRTRSLCPWKGLASYYSVTVDGITHRDAAWYYPHPSFLARKIKGRVAFWNGVRVQKVSDTATTSDGKVKAPSHTHTTER